MGLSIETSTLIKKRLLTVNNEVSVVTGGGTLREDFAEVPSAIIRLDVVDDQVAPALSGIGGQVHVFSVPVDRGVHFLR